MIELMLGIALGFMLGFPCGVAICISNYRNQIAQTIAIVDKTIDDINQLKKTSKVNVIV